MGNLGALPTLWLRADILSTRTRTCWLWRKSRWHGKPSHLHINFRATSWGRMSVALFVRLMWRWDIAQSDISRNVHTASCTQERRSGQWWRIGMSSPAVLVGINDSLSMAVIPSRATFVYVCRFWPSWLLWLCIMQLRVHVPESLILVPSGLTAHMLEDQLQKLMYLKLLSIQTGARSVLVLTILNCFERFHRCLCLPNGLHIMSVLSTYFAWGIVEMYVF